VRDPSEEITPVHSERGAALKKIISANSSALLKKPRGIVTTLVMRQFSASRDATVPLCRPISNRWIAESAVLRIVALAVSVTIGAILGSQSLPP
jgi:hypothetical protein